MIGRIRKYIEEEKLLPPGGRLILGLSGGADSVVLLHILKLLGYDCLAAHCNFHLRGEESQRDQKFVEDLTLKWNIPLSVTHSDTRAIAKERAVSIEMAARDIRYQWFEQLREKFRADAIAVAHHRDDSVETLLLNLIRGTGIRGVTGIRPRNGFVVRPMLCLSRNEVLDFAEKEKIPYVTDSSNLQDEFTRNKIRLHLLPLLESINPSARESIGLTAKNLAEVEKIYETAIREGREKVFNRERQSIDIEALRAFPSPESLLFEILREYRFGKEVVREVAAALDSISGKEFYSPGYRLVKDRNFLFLIERQRAETIEPEYSLPGDLDRIDFPLRLEMKFQDNEPGFPIEKSRDVAFLDRDKLHFPLTLRRWRHGDRFVPFGMAGSQKLSDFFNNAKFTLPEKEKVWLLLSGDEIVWIVNHRISNLFRVTKETKKICILKVF